MLTSHIYYTLYSIHYTTLGMGGVLYRPQFMHSILFNRDLLHLTRTADDIMFRLASLAKGIPVVTACINSPKHHLLGGGRDCVPLEKIAEQIHMKLIHPHEVYNKDTTPYLTEEAELVSSHSKKVSLIQYRVYM